jgi:hypothetical protein
MNRFSALIAGLTLFAACAPPDPVYTRCVEEKKAYCNRLFACVALGGLSVQVNFEDESQCNTEQTKSCMQVSEQNACPGGTSSTYSSAKHDQCIADQKTQSCAAFANRPTSCESYCCTSSTGSCT